MSGSTSREMPLRTVWGALVMSQVMLVAVLFMIPIEAQPEDMTLAFALGGAALFTAGMALIFPKNLFRTAVTNANIEKEERPDPDALPGFGKTITSAKDPEAAMARFWPAYNTRVILAMALGEAVSLFGFVLKFQGHDWLIAAPFFVVGTSVMLLQFPSEDACLKEAEAALGFPIRPRDHA